MVVSWKVDECLCRFLKITCHVKAFAVKSLCKKGTECSFIHNVTKLTTDIDGNTVVSNDFDGICCTKEISEEVLNLAREKSGFTNAEFIIKPIDEEYEDFIIECQDNVATSQKILRDRLKK